MHDLNTSAGENRRDKDMTAGLENRIPNVLFTITPLLATGLLFTTKPPLWI